MSLIIMPHIPRSLNGPLVVFVVVIAVVIVIVPARFACWRNAPPTASPPNLPLPSANLACSLTCSVKEEGEKT